MATHSSILAWRLPWTEEPGELHTVHGVARVRCDLATKPYQEVYFTSIPTYLLHIMLLLYLLKKTLMLVKIEKGVTEDEMYG